MRADSLINGKEMVLDRKTRVLLPKARFDAADAAPKNMEPFAVPLDPEGVLELSRKITAAYRLKEPAPLTVGNSLRITVPKEVAQHLQIKKGDKLLMYSDSGRVMARVVAYLFQKVARKLGKTVVVATTHDDLFEDFQPDVLVRKGFEGDVEVVKNEVKPKRCSILEKVRIEKGSREDYEKLKLFHYRSKNEKELGSLRMRDCYRLLYGDSLIGVIVYSVSYLNLKPRNMVFGDRYVYTPGDLYKARLINEEIARISRVVIHPKFRGIGLGEYLVKETLPKVNAKVVEVLAVMARYNPFFEKAGMLRVDYQRKETAVDKKIKAFLEAKSFDFKLAKSKAYCRSFFSRLNEEDKKVLLGYLSEFVQQPFVKIKTVTPDLISRAFVSEGVYLYWINAGFSQA
ncbi:AbrB/MazE/SpoVT family DNA-binding domain-containing protein [Candidatus Bathyarchaeota archaeon]|nr:AbrB/MazE/SpoVT family DNA-binding domain-containing protein [Candidatus Bathyarchaeota archaeon]